MKKSFLVLFAICLIFISCNNSHFSNTGSVSIYLPSLEQSMVPAAREGDVVVIGGNGGDVEPPVLSYLNEIVAQGYSPEPYYEITLLQNGETKHFLYSFQNKIVTIDSIKPGVYDVLCEAGFTRSTEKTVFARGQSTVSVVPGIDQTVDLEIHAVPLIINHPYGGISYFGQNLGYFTFTVSASSLGIHGMEQQNDLIFYLYRSGKLVQVYKEGNSQDFEIDGVAQPRKAILSPSYDADSNCFKFSSYNWLDSSIDYDFSEYYVEFENKTTGEKNKTDSFRIYYVSSNAVLTDFHVEYKGESKVLTEEQFNNPNLNDFRITLTYKTDDDYHDLEFESASFFVEFGKISCETTGFTLGPHIDYIFSANIDGEIKNQTITFTGAE